MELQRVWTRQHKNILTILEQEGRYIAKQRYIEQENEDTAPFFLEVYAWYTEAGSRIVPAPEDVRYPIWVSLSEGSRLPGTPNTVSLELLLPAELVLSVDMEQWSRVLDYSYIAANAEDAERHRQLLKQYNVGDAQAYMSRFYPDIKREIRASWQRIFSAGQQAQTTGTIWEIKADWVQKVRG